MELEIITIYVICCEFLQAIGHQEDDQCRMSDAEVMTTAIVAMLHFGGNYAQARRWLKSLHPDDVGQEPFFTTIESHKLSFCPLFQSDWSVLESRQPGRYLRHRYLPDTRV